MRRWVVVGLLLLAFPGCSEDEKSAIVEPADLSYSLTTTCSQVNEDLLAIVEARQAAKEDGDRELARSQFETATKLHSALTATIDPELPKPLRGLTASEALDYCRDHPEDTLQDARARARLVVRRKARLCQTGSGTEGPLKAQGPLITEPGRGARTARGRLLLSKSRFAAGETFFVAVRNLGEVTELTYGMFWGIERRSGDGWESVRIPFTSHPFIGLGALAGRTGSCVGGRLRKDMEPGQYRITVDVSPGIRAQRHDRFFTVWAPFRVGP